MNNSPIQIQFWKRYVDDIVCSLGNDDLSSFLTYINSQNRSIQFECETEKDGCLNFLDIKISRNRDNSLSFGIHRKSTNTGKYLNFNSNNPIAHKKSVAFSLFSRSKVICDSTEEKKKEDKLIYSQLKENDYPNQFIKQCYDKVNQNPSSSITEKQENIRYVKAPYIRGASERISRMLKPFDVKLAMKPSNSLSSKLQNVKDKIPDIEKSSVVYKIKCRDCDSCYIGETGRQLGTRILEHRSNVRSLYNRSQLVEHITSHNHSIDYDGASRLAKHKHDRSRKILEACHTHTT